MPLQGRGGTQANGMQGRYERNINDDRNDDRAFDKGFSYGWVFTAFRAVMGLRSYVVPAFLLSGLVAASAGIGLWGGLLLYFLFREGIAAMGFG